ncbi:MAG: SGNH/GDSL hydrolase family protein [Proteobacteria bacterium]|nr:SGNH/GDSL hydrolase family protein [Pseudomonadota bacterium]
MLLLVITLHAARMVPEVGNSPDWHEGVQLVQGPHALPARFLGGMARMASHTQLILDAPDGANSVVVHGRLTGTSPASSIRFALRDSFGRGNAVLIPIDPEIAELAATLQRGSPGRIDGSARAAEVLHGGDVIEVGLSADGTVTMDGQRLDPSGSPVAEPASLLIAPTTAGVELSGVDWFDATGGLLEERRFTVSSPFNQRRSGGRVLKIALGAMLLALIAVGIARLRGHGHVAGDALTPTFPVVVLLLIPGIVHPTLHPIVLGLDLTAAGFLLAWWLTSARPPPADPRRRWLPGAVCAVLWVVTWGLGLVAAAGDGGDPEGGEAALHLDVASRYEHPSRLVHQRADFHITAEAGAVVELQLRYSQVPWRRPPLSVVLSFDEALDSAILRDGLPIATGPTLDYRAGWRVPVLVTVAGERIEVFADNERILASRSAPPRAGGLALQAVAGEADVELLSYQRAPNAWVGTVGLILRPLRVTAGGWFVASLLAVLLGLLVGGPKRMEVESDLRQSLLVPAIAAGLLDALIVADMLSSGIALPLTPEGLHGLTLVFLGGVCAVVGAWSAMKAADGLRNRLVVLAAAPLLAVVALEGMGRFTDAQHLWEPAWLQYAGESDHAWFFSPGGVPFSDNLVEDNAFRGRRIPLHRASDERRIAVFGGSQAWGFGTPDSHDTYPAQLEHLLGVGTTVLNAGINAGSSFNARMTLRGRVLAFEPELAVFVFGANDNRFFWGDAQEWEVGSRRGRTFVSRMAGSSPLLSTFAGGSRVLTGLTAMRRRGMTEEDQTAFMSENLLAAINDCRSRSVEVLLVAEPTWDTLNEKQLVEAAQVTLDDPLSSEFHKAMRRLAKEADAPFATVADRLIDRTPEVLFTDTIHFSNEGHRAMAAALRDILYEEGLAGPTEPDPGENPTDRE